MIFVTVGTQLPFDRLIQAVDEWAGRHPEVKVFAQIGPSTYQATHIQTAQFIGADECVEKVKGAKLIVAHAGMGSVLTALELGKPIIVMPRRAALNEHRNDHQVATARGLLARGKAVVAFDEAHLVEKLEHRQSLIASASADVSSEASPRLIEALRQFISTGDYNSANAREQWPAMIPTMLDRKPAMNSATEFSNSERSNLVLERRRNDSRSNTRIEIDLQPEQDGPIATATRITRSKPVLRQVDSIARHGPGGVSHRGDDRVSNLRAIVLMLGALQPSPFALGIRRSLLHLPVTNQMDFCDLWREQIKSVSQALGRVVPCRIMVGGSAVGPRLSEEDRSAQMFVETDRAALRGTGGVLRDLADEYHDGCILVANAAQLMMRDLAEVTGKLADSNADVTIVANADGSPSNLMLMDCQTLRHLPSNGFVDLKEQGLPLIARHHRVSVVQQNRALGITVRTLSDYLDALRAYRRIAEGTVHYDEPFSERWQSKFSIIEPGAYVAPEAHLHDAVILSGGVVERKSVVVRSIVCDGGFARRAHPTIDTIASIAGREFSQIDRCALQQGMRPW